jgi:hypothetical protein
MDDGIGDKENIDKMFELYLTAFLETPQKNQRA